jgi:hypothetical protein
MPKFQLPGCEDAKGTINSKKEGGKDNIHDNARQYHLTIRHSQEIPIRKKEEKFIQDNTLQDDLIPHNQAKARHSRHK